MYRVPISTKRFEKINVLEISVGTNCPSGGDAGPPARTIFRLTDLGGTDISVRLNSQAAQTVDSVEIILGGDSECQTFTHALKYALEVLHRKGTMSAHEFAYEEIE